MILKQEYDDVRIEYGEIINTSEISNGDDAIDDVWNVYNHKKFTDRKHGTFINSLLLKLIEKYNI